MKFVLIVTSLSDDNGGSYAARQFLDAALNCGFQVTVIQRSFNRTHSPLVSADWLQLLSREVRFFEFRYAQFIHRVDRIICRLFGRSDSRDTLAWALNLLIDSLSLVFIVWDRKCIRCLQSADLVIFNEVPDGTSLVRRLRMITNAKIACTHYAPVDYVLKVLTRNRNGIDDLSSYISLYAAFDWLIFEVASEAYKFNAITGGNSAVSLFPSICESKFSNMVERDAPFDHNGVFNVVIVSTIQMRKGLHALPDVLFNLSSRSIPAVFHIVGKVLDADYLAHIQYQIEVMGLWDSVKIYGHRNDYLNFINSADAVLHLSTAEGVSTALREAMYLGKPIVSFSIPGVRDLLSDGENALLCEPFSTQQISDALERLHYSRSLCSEIGRRARRSCLENCLHSEYEARFGKLMLQIARSAVV